MVRQPETWHIVREVNKKEFDVAANWHQTYRPDAPETQQFFEGLPSPTSRDKAGDKSPALKTTSLRHRLSMPPSSPSAPPVAPGAQDGAVQGESSPRKRIHIHHKHKAFCPAHASTIARRIADEAAARGEDPDAALAAWQRANRERDAALVARNEPPSSAAFAAQPITYTLHRHAQDAKYLSEPPPEVLLPGLPIPHVIGTSTCRMLTGGQPPVGQYKWSHRPHDEFPDFRKVTKPADIKASVMERGEDVLPRGSRVRRGIENLSAELIFTRTGRDDINGTVAQPEDALPLERQRRVPNTDRPSDDRLVEHQMHHAMMNRHRQFIEDPPRGAQQLAAEQWATMQATRGLSVLHAVGPDATGATQFQSSNIVGDASHQQQQAAHHQARQAAEMAERMRRATALKLVRVPVDRTAFRQKHPVKTHLEAMYSAEGRVMMRGARVSGTSPMAGGGTAKSNMK